MVFVCARVIFRLFLLAYANKYTFWYDVYLHPSHACMYIVDCVSIYMKCCSLFRWHDHSTTERNVSLVMGTVLLKLKRCSLVPLLLLWRRLKHSLRFKSMLHICAYIVHDDKWEFRLFFSFCSNTYKNTILEFDWKWTFSLLIFYSFVWFFCFRSFRMAIVIQIWLIFTFAFNFWNCFQYKRVTFPTLTTLTMI